MKLKLISDGTAAGTRLEVDEQALTGVTSVAWELGAASGPRRARVRLELSDIEVEIHQPGRERDS